MTVTPSTAGASLGTFFNPRSVAIIGASSNPTGISGQFLRYLRGYGYRGQVHPVNPRHQEIAGLPAYPSVVDAPGPVDVAIVVVPSQAVLQAMRDCASAGVPFVVDGASELFIALWGERGRHARTSVGVSTLPQNACVEVDAIFELRRP